MRIFDFISVVSCKLLPRVTQFHDRNECLLLICPCHFYVGMCMLVFTSCGCAACVCVRRVNAAASYTPANSLTDDTAKIQLKHERRDGRPFGQNLGPKVLSTQEAGTWGMGDERGREKGREEKRK